MKKKTLSVILTTTMLGTLTPTISASAAEKVNNDLGYVYEAVHTPSGGEAGSYGTFIIPAINIASDGADQINKEFISYYSKIEPDWDYCSTYETYQYGNILSVVLYVPATNDCDEYYSQTIDLSTGNRLSNRDLIAMAGVSEYDFLNHLRNIMGEMYIDMYSMLSSDMFYGELYRKTISDEFCNMDIPMYISNNGELMAVPYIGSMAGASQYRHVIETGYNVVGRSLTAINNQAPVVVTVDGTALQFESDPIIENDRTLVPMRAIFEALGATVSWDGSTQTVTSYKDDNTIVMTIGSGTIYLNGLPIESDVAPILINGFTYVPVRVISESLGCMVDWNGDTRTVTIQSYANTVPSEDNNTKYIGKWLGERNDIDVWHNTYEYIYIYYADDGSINIFPYREQGSGHFMMYTSDVLRFDSLTHATASIYAGTDEDSMNELTYDITFVDENTLILRRWGDSDDIETYKRTSNNSPSDDGIEVY